MPDKPDIPSELDFAQAEKAMRELRSREAKARRFILKEIPDEIPCHEVWAWYSKPGLLAISFIFPTDSDLEASLNNGQQTAVESVVVRAGDSIGVASARVEFHSHEYVKRRFNGDYDKYFR